MNELESRRLVPLGLLRVLWRVRLVVRIHFNVRVVVGPIVGLLGVLFTLQNFGVLLLNDGPHIREIVCHNTENVLT